MQVSANRGWHFSLTPRFSGVKNGLRANLNRFNGFHADTGPSTETVETVSLPPPRSFTPLKRGVNETNPV
jgi:hypothetical protein